MEEGVDKQYRIALVGNQQLSLGFRLAGITESYVVADTQEAESRLRELLAKDSIGIIIVSSSVKKLVKDRRLHDAMESSILPLVVQVPEPNEGINEEDTLRSLIMRAIGIDITKIFNGNW
ncbi:MAG: V-type ATP synthase subunit F [Candidatus Micrarchaeaceae archaeon]